MSSAWSITSAVNPPRAAFLDFPLGHTAGRPHFVEEQVAILQAALVQFQTTTVGSIERLPFFWQDNDNWKRELLADQTDDRIERFAEPQYQTDDDALTADVACPSCIWLNGG